MDTKKLRQKILDLAIRGKLVPQDPNDEPASVLLERIRAEKERLIKEGKIKRSKKTATDDEIEAPFEIPESWVWVRLKDIAILINGDRGVNYPNKNEYVSNGIAWINTGHITNDGYLSEANMNYISQEKYDLLGSGKIQSGDLVYCLRGATFGKVARVEPYSQGAIASSLVIIRVYLSFIREYLFRVLKSDYAKKQLNNFDNGTAQPNLAAKDVEKYFIPLPPLAEQQRIANEVEHWFSVIDALESNEDDLLKAINQAKSKILDLAIHGKLVPQDPNDEPAIELLKCINPNFEPCDNEHDSNLLPNSWCWTTLGSLFNHNTGKALNKSDSQEGSVLPYITTSNVYWNRFDLSEIKKMFFKDSEIDKCTITKGDLLVCEGGDIGRSAIWNFDYDICIQNHIHRLRAKGEISNFLYLYVLMFYKWSDRIHGKGIGLQGLSSGLLDKLVVPLPPYQEQLRIVAKIEELFAVLDSIKESLE